MMVPIVEEGLPRRTAMRRHAAVRFPVVTHVGAASPPGAARLSPVAYLSSVAEEGAQEAEAGAGRAETGVWPAAICLSRSYSASTFST